LSLASHLDCRAAHGDDHTAERSNSDHRADGSTTSPCRVISIGRASASADSCCAWTGAAAVGRAEGGHPSEPDPAGTECAGRRTSSRGKTSATSAGTTAAGDAGAAVAANNRHCRRASNPASRDVAGYADRSQAQRVARDKASDTLTATGLDSRSGYAEAGRNASGTSNAFDRDHTDGAHARRACQARHPAAARAGGKACAAERDRAATSIGSKVAATAVDAVSGPQAAGITACRRCGDVSTAADTADIRQTAVTATGGCKANAAVVTSTGGHETSTAAAVTSTDGCETGTAAGTGSGRC
jgi:hypothetical protein